MQNITYDYPASVMYQREEGLRRARLTGLAYDRAPAAGRSAGHHESPQRPLPSTARLSTR